MRGWGEPAAEQHTAAECRASAAPTLLRIMSAVSVRLMRDRSFSALLDILDVPS